MDNSTLISLAALLTSILALPVSYFVATRQVKVGLDEHEQRVRKRTRKLLADRLDELMSLFFSAARSIAGIEKPHLEQNKLSEFIQVIDQAVIETMILERLGKSIDDYLESGDTELDRSSELRTRLNMIRGQIARGTRPPENYATWDILQVCRGNDLAEELRKV